MRVLIVDDHPLFAEGLRNLLSERGIDVVELAQDGHEALTRAGASGYVLKSEPTESFLRLLEGAGSARPCGSWPTACCTRRWPRASASPNAP
ncbi:MAG: response regulator [Trueperaceae bacterium]|nr:response regulator [Trueperaceae bacterium]